MRKNLLLTTVLVFALSIFAAPLALAGCGSCPGDHAAVKAEEPHSHASTSCSGKSADSCAGMSAAECAAACAAKGVSSADCAKHAAACATKGASASSCGTKGASATCSTRGASASSCGTKGASASCSTESTGVIGHYMGLKAAMGGHCSSTKGNTASAWQGTLRQAMADAETDEQRRSLATLASYLNDWPSDKKAQEARFAQVSEWAVSYCEQFPAQAPGAKVVTCPTSGHRWVELEESGEDSKS